MFLTTHYLDEADALCDRILVIDHGEIVAAGTPAELKREVSGDRVALQLHDPARLGSARAVLERIAGVTVMRADGDLLDFSLPDASAALPGVMAALAERRCDDGRDRGSPADARRRVPVPDRSRASRPADRRLRRLTMRFLNETWLVFVRAMRLSLRNKVWLIIGLMQPLLYLALFGPLLKRIAGMPGFPKGNSWAVFTPGLLVQLGIFGALFVGFGLIAEVREGVIERMRVTPASRLALLAGRVLRDAVVLLVQSTVLLAAAYAFGLRAPIGGVVLAVLLVAFVGAAFASASYAVALLTGTEEGMASIANSIAVPLLLLSGILLPMTLAPGWLRTVSNVNPVKHIVDAMRALFQGHVMSGTVGVGVLVGAALIAVGLMFGTRTFQRDSA